VSLSDRAEGPQVLIYHTHSQEGYVDGVEGDASTSVLAVGDYLEQLLTEKGFRVLHHKGEYDLKDRNHAYSDVLPVLEQIMAENPSIEVVIDLHRDGVPETLHLVTEVEGRPTAKIMFFNGLSKTTAQGELGYLPNPYIENNLALSFQLQLAAEEYYPGWTRKIYLKGFRYNQHVCSKCLLVEVGAQNNSLEEAKNAMIPLADILDKVLNAEK
jgi:stage II sporulation protein P